MFWRSGAFALVFGFQHAKPHSKNPKTTAIVRIFTFVAPPSSEPTNTLAIMHAEDHVLVVVAEAFAE
ncbi:hypothetical protein MU1_01650 [Paenibacillus glycanilyticus]|uniref:Secreted protein n=1 Tax=Paenibacillus glycanilyticus TaxID=126569 RepID=A0ABQ6G4B9_9BACL|nr:hypothetical protein MU1_01650 [Paenibacillus glycanilyticus]